MKNAYKSVVCTVQSHGMSFAGELSVVVMIIVK